MDPILNIIKYLFNKKQISIDNETLDSFFDNGVYFPKLIEIAFNIDEIPGIINNPESSLQKNKNNDTALQFLFFKNQDIEQITSDFHTEADKVNLLELILTKHCFKIDEQEIIRKSNIIVNPLGMHFDKKDDLISQKCILSLLNILTDGNIKINTDLKNFSKIMQSSFEKAKVPLLINELSFDTKKQFTFLIQIEIIFDCFSEKVNQLLGKQKKSKKKKEKSKHKKSEKKKDKEKKSNQKEMNEKIELNELKIEKESSNKTHVFDKQKQDDLNSDNFVEDIIDEQSFIDVEIDDDSSDSSDSDNNYTKKKITDLDDYEENAVLNTINAIGKSKNLHFENFRESVKKSNPLKFVKILLKEDDSFEKEMSSCSGKIDDIIRYLGKKDPIFNIKVFDFENPKHAISSAVSFYKLLLNRYFLKKTKSELIKRSSTIIFNDFKENSIQEEGNIDEDEQFLSNDETYHVLFNFVNRHSNEKNKKIIPKIFEEESLTVFYPKKINIILYQLQFIFDALDANGFVSYFHESVLNFVRKAKLIKVPDTKTLAASIRSKNIGLIMQIKRCKSFSSSNNIMNQSHDNDNENDLNMLKKAEIKKPEKFEDRQVKKLITRKDSSKSSIKKHSSSELMLSAESYWNQTDKNYVIHNGAFYDIENVKQDQQICDENINISPNRMKYMFTSIPKKNKKYNLYKFFHYNEQLQKWEMNLEIISNFIKDNLLDKSGKKLCLIVYINSDEKDSIILNSKLFGYLYPDLDDDNIYVYALCDKILSLLNYYLNVLKENESQIMPIFLLLHVPESKKKLDNIRAILLKIYFFLSFVCDIQIYISSKNNINDQNNLLESIEIMKSSYFNSSQAKIFDKCCSLTKENSNKINKKLSNPKLTSTKKSTKDLSDDGDDDDYDDHEEDYIMTELITNSDDNNINDHFEKIDHKLISNRTKSIVIMNDETFHDDISEINNPIRINVNDAITYHAFLSALTTNASDAQNECKDILHKFELFSLTEVNNKYIDLRCKKEWKSELKEIIYDRFKQYKIGDNNNSNDFILLSKLFNEIKQINPSIDSIFHQECNLILDEIKNDIIYKNKDTFITELNKSSENGLNYLKQIINDQCFWSPEKKDFIINSHENFLRNELFCIIKSLYPRNEFPFALKSYSPMLENQIKNDKTIIEKLFLDVEKKNLSSENQFVDFIDEMNKGTNYSIRESERVREIKVIAETGHLEKVIPQDF